MAVADAPSNDAVVVRNLRIELVSSGEDIVDQIVLEVTAGEVLGLVGESGSGKTTVGMALLGYFRPGGKGSGGEGVMDGLIHPPGPGHRAEPGAANRAPALGDAGGSFAVDERGAARRARSRDTRG